MAWVSSEAQVILAKFFVACFGALSPSQSGFASWLKYEDRFKLPNTPARPNGLAGSLKIRVGLRGQVSKTLTTEGSKVSISERRSGV
jgi:hypothetical protein